MHDVFIREIPLPLDVEGVVLPNPDLTFDIYLNSRLCEERQRATLEHEMNHIRMDHLYDLRPVWIVEGEAG